jgi:hypothetical protein
MPYGCSLSALLDILSTTSPDEARQLLIEYRNSEHGLLSVGLKIHVLQPDAGIDKLVEDLGGAKPVLNKNVYRRAGASLCLVLPPVGSAKAAIKLLELIGRHTGCAMFGNPNVQLQVCSPGRLDNRRSGMLAIAFYLGSDTLRRFTLDQFTTTVTDDEYYRRGRRLVIYDAPGPGSGFDHDFEWWRLKQSGRRKVKRRLPFNNPQRTDLLIGSASAIDIENINLVATLLVHNQFAGFCGYWQRHGEEFERALTQLLDAHMLTGLLEAPWVHPGFVVDTNGDRAFFSAMQELTASAFEDRERIQKNRRTIFRSLWAARPPGLLEEAHTLITRHREQLVLEAQYTEGGAT